MNKIILLVIGIGILGFIGYLTYSIVGNNVGEPKVSVSGGVPSVMPTKEPVDYKASFAIFTNGTFRVFTASMYHNLSSDVFIQAANPNIVQVKKAGITWDDFFKTLPLKLTKDCLTTGTKETFCTGTSGTLWFYLNGREDTDVLDKLIGQEDQLLVTFGKEKQAQIQQQLKRIPSIEQ